MTPPHALRVPFLALALGACSDGGSPPGPAASAAPAAASATQQASASTQQAPAAPSASAAPARIAAQHVLIAYKGTKVGNAKRTKEEARKLAEEVRKKAKEGADFAKLAEEYSDDPASKERMGSVGTFARDGMVEPFADAAFALQVGEVSDVVETYFGFHVIKRNQ